VKKQMVNPNKYTINLSQEQREGLKKISQNGQAPAKKILHAQMLLLSDIGHPEGGWTDEQISSALGIHPYTVARVRKRYVNKGEAPALNRQVRQSPPTPKKIDGEKEAHLIAICCSTAPEGRARWTLSLLVSELKQRGIVTQISRETVRQTLKKINYDLGKNKDTVSLKKI
jgi:transposase